MMPFDARLLRRLGQTGAVVAASGLVAVLAGAIATDSVAGSLEATLVAAASALAGGATWAILAARSRLRLVQEALDTTPAAVAVYDARDNLVVCNKRYREVLGVPPDAFVTGVPYAELVRRSLAMTMEGDALEAELSRRLLLHRTADGQPSDRRYPNNRWLRVSKVRTRGGANVGIALDVTEYHELRERLEAEMRRFEALARSAPVGICQVDAEGRILFVNGTLLAILGLSGADELERDDLPFTHGPRQGNGFRALLSAVRGEGAESELCVGSPPSARDILVRKAFVVPGPLGERLIAPDQRAGGDILIFIDITDRKNAEARIRYLALHDPLTGARNRLAFNEDLPRASEAASEDQPASLVVIDLDRFKPVNDVYGHAAGDELLRQIVRRMSPRLKTGMTLYRMGGDEFAILVAPGAEPDPVGFARGLVASLCAPFQVEGHAILVGASAGVSSLPRDTTSVEALVHYADLALYHAKRAGGGEAVEFDQTVLSSVDSRKRMELELEDAIQAGDLSLVFQPVYAKDRRTVLGAEALSRWRRAGTNEMVPPDVFVPLAENSGLIRRLDMSVLEAAVRQFAGWSSAGLGLHAILVNMSVRTFAAPGIVEHVAGVLRRHFVPGRSVVIELTESFAIRDAEAVSETMRAVNALGVRFAIDDFGTGYTSLKLVSTLPISFIKIDKSFVRDLRSADRPHVQQVVRAIADLTRAMGLDLIAEGIENEEELASLAAEGCRYFQGNLLSSPLPPQDFERLLARGAAAASRRAGHGAPVVPAEVPPQR